MSRTGIVQFLGGFSLAIGFAELIAPGRLTRLIGLDGRQRLLQGYGLREIAAGLGLLSRTRSGPWLWARTAGDVLDIVTLATALAGRSEQRKRALIAFSAVAPIVLLDIYMAATSGGQED